MLLSETVKLVSQSRHGKQLPYPIFLVMHENLFESNNRSISFRSSLVDFTIKYQLAYVTGAYQETNLQNSIVKQIKPHPNVPSPSFPKNSNSRIFEQPRNRVCPWLSRSNGTLEDGDEIGNTIAWSRIISSERGLIEAMSYCKIKRLKMIKSSRKNVIWHGNCRNL